MKHVLRSWKLLVAEDKTCGRTYVPVAEFEFGPDAAADNGILGIVVGKYMLSADVPGSTYKAIALAKLAFAR